MPGEGISSNFLFESGLVPVKLDPEEDHRVWEFGLGLKDVVKRPTQSVNQLRPRDFAGGILRLKAKLEAVGPRTVAFKGKLAYEKFHGSPAKVGWQPRALAGAGVYVLPFISGRNTSLTRVAKLRHFRPLAQWVKRHA